MRTANELARLRTKSESGYAEGRNVAIEFRWAEDQRDLRGRRL